MLLRVYFGIWILLALLFAVLLGGSHSVSWQVALACALPLCLLYACICLPGWYICRVFPLSGPPPTRLIGTHGLSALLAAALLTGLARFIPGGRLNQLQPLIFGAGVLLYLTSAAFNYLMLGMSAAREAQERLLRYDVEAREAELRALKAQINPHFLFNSLNSISALAGVDPAKAREMCVLLGDFLRRTLGLGEKRSIPLAEELGLVHTFLAVEKVRFGERIQMHETVAEETLGLEVPPLLLQPLVENAVVHGVAHLLDGGWIRVKAELQAGRLILTVENERDGEMPPRRGQGVGQANVRRRLTTRFGARAGMHIQAEGNRYCVRLELPAESDEGD